MRNLFLFALLLLASGARAAEIQDLTELAAAPASGDLLVVVDVSDSTDDPAGTGKRITVANLLAYTGAIGGQVNYSQLTGTVPNAPTVTFADAASDTTTFPALGTSATGSLAPATDAGLSYNASTNALTVAPAAADGTAALTVDSSTSTSFVRLNDNGTVEIDGDSGTGTNLLRLKFAGTQMFNFAWTGTFEGGAASSRDFNWAGGITTVAGGTGVIRAPLAVEAVTTTKTPAAGEGLEIYTNTGDADGALLPLTNDPTAGNCFYIALTVAQSFTITPGAGESLFMGADQCNASMTASGDGASVMVCAVVGGSGGQWNSFGASGFTCND